MSQLDAFINQFRVGQLVHQEVTGLFDFNYADSWVADKQAFSISPSLPFQNEQLTVAPAIHSRSVRCFFENLLPEGRLLDEAAAANALSKSNLIGLLNALGRESTGAISLVPEGQQPEQAPASKRLVTDEELSERIRNRAEVPFSVWDGRVRLSIAGLQDKLAVLRDDTGANYLVEGYELASTHILKPIPMSQSMSTLVANEHFCMKLANALGLDVAKVELVRVPQPVLVVKRFDRRVQPEGVQRLHVIDGCQALDLPPSYKYERNFGSGVDVRNIRDGASYCKLFALEKYAVAPAQFRDSLIKWALFQYLIGNSDAHGKNLSFHVSEAGLRLAPAYDLVSVVTYQNIDSDLAMSIGDVFRLEEVAPYQWYEFAVECGINYKVLAREMQKMAKKTPTALSELNTGLYTDDEKNILDQIRTLVLQQAVKLEVAAKELPKIQAS